MRVAVAELQATGSAGGLFRTNREAAIESTGGAGGFYGRGDLAGAKSKDAALSAASFFSAAFPW